LPRGNKSRKLRQKSVDTKRQQANNQQATTNYQQPTGIWQQRRATKAAEATTLRRHLPAKLGVGFGHLVVFTIVVASGPQYGVLKRLYPQSEAFWPAFCFWANHSFVSFLWCGLRLHGFTRKESGQQEVGSRLQSS